MTHSHFQSRLLLSPQLHTTSSLGTSLFVCLSLHVCICLCCVCIYIKKWEEVCVAYCYICQHVLIVTEVIANVKSLRKPRSGKGEGERLHSYYMLFKTVKHKHTHTHRDVEMCICFLGILCAYCVCSCMFTHTYTPAHTVTHRNCSVFPSQGNVNTWQSKNVFPCKHYHLSFVNDFSILKRTTYTSTNQINPSVQPGFIICPISVLFVIN